jgi:hypothetical protein
MLAFVVCADAGTSVLTAFTLRKSASANPPRVYFRDRLQRKSTPVVC